MPSAPCIFLIFVALLRIRFFCGYWSFAQCRNRVNFDGAYGWN
jgi:hypothetical protein